MSKLDVIWIVLAIAGVAAALSSPTDSATSAIAASPTGHGGSATSATTSPTSRAEPTGAAQIEASVDRYVRPLRDLEVFDGVVLLARGGKVLVSKAYGMANLELGVPNTPGQRFRIASLSKLFTAMAIGRLWEQGALDLHTPLSRFLPEFPRAESISVEQLLRHRAGVPNMNDLPCFEDSSRVNTLDALIHQIEGRPLDFPPGSVTRYSNGNYAVLAKVIERASGRRYEDYLRDEILTPLGMNDTGHEPDGFLLERRAYGYQPDPRRRSGRVPAPFQQMATKTGGGSLYSTAADLFRFGQALYGDNVLRRATYEAVIPSEDRVVSLTGRCPGFNALFLRRLDDDVTVVVLSNNYASGMLAQAGRDLAALALGKPCAPPRYRSDLAFPATRLAPMAGEYDDISGSMPFLEGKMLEIRLEEDYLTAYAGDRPLDVLIPQSGRTFLLRNFWSELTFDSTSSALVYRPLYRTGEYTFTRGGAR